MMRNRVAIGVLLCAAGAWAWQDAFTRLGLGRETFEKIVSRYVIEIVSHNRPLEMPPAGGLKKPLMALDDSSRAAVVRECGLAAKAFVMSAAFQASYDAYIRNLGAVNHGITVTDRSAEVNAALKKGDLEAARKVQENVMRENFRQGVIQRLPSLANYDSNTISTMAGIDAGLMEMSNPTTAAEKAAVAKAKQMLQEAVKLASGDIGKARELYRAALMTGAGLKDEAQAKNSAEEEKRNEEQRRYNELRLRPRVKNHLLDFVAVAKSVDFQAATVTKGGRQVFVNRAYERQSELWKMLFRLGPGGTKAAIQVAEQWASEL